MGAQLNFLTANQPHALICNQEVVHSQLVDLQASLGHGWTHVGVGRDDGKTKGEYSPIWFRPAAWDLVDNRTYWLSPTPDVVGSKGWDAALPRIVTVARLRDRATEGELVCMCTHFDHRGQVAREESAKLLVRLADEWQGGDDDGEPARVPVFLGGDLNIEPSNQAYKNLVAEGAMRDTKDVVGPARWFGNEMTFTGFTDSRDDDTRIDHVFVKDALDMEFLGYSVLSNRFDDGVYISDHRPVVVDVKVPVV